MAHLILHPAFDVLPSMTRRKLRCVLLGEKRYLLHACVLYSQGEEGMALSLAMRSSVVLMRACLLMQGFSTCVFINSCTG